MGSGGAGALLQLIFDYAREERNFAAILYLIAVLIGLVLPAVDEVGA